MNIELLEEKLENIADENYTSIIELIIGAVRDYPLFGLNDTNVYFSEVKERIGKEAINIIALRRYIDLNSNKMDEINIWVITSLTSLLEAFKLMEIYKLSFEEVINVVEE